MSTFLEELTGRENEKRSTANVDFLALVDKLAGGDDPDIRQAEKVLVAAGKTAEDLQAAVDRAKRIAELEKAIAADEGEIERQTAKMERCAGERDRLETDCRQAYERFNASTIAFTDALSLRQQASERRNAAQRELAILREQSA